MSTPERPTWHRGSKERKTSCPAHMRGWEGLGELTEQEIRFRLRSLDSQSEVPLHEMILFLSRKLILHLATRNERFGDASVRHGTSAAHWSLQAAQPGATRLIDWLPKTASRCCDVDAIFNVHRRPRTDGQGNQHDPFNPFNVHVQDLVRLAEIVAAAGRGLHCHH